MRSMYETGSPIVDQMSRLRISGNMIPASWFHTIRKEAGTPNLLAIVILADIVCWYRAVEVRDEVTGQFIGFRKKFQSDLLQRSYQQLADQFGITKQDAVDAIADLEKLGVVCRIFRTQEMNGQTFSNVLFLKLDVDILERLTYPEQAEESNLDAKGRCPPEGSAIKNREPYVKNINQVDHFIDSYEEMETRMKEQISYDILKHDYPYDKRIEELLGIMVEVMESTAAVIRVNKEEKPAQVVKAQFEKIGKEHIEFVLRCMSESSAKAHNIRALLITALYNSVHTISTYYGNLVQYHRAKDSQEGIPENRKKVEE